MENGLNLLEREKKSYSIDHFDSYCDAKYIDGGMLLLHAITPATEAFGESAQTPISKHSKL